VLKFAPIADFAPVSIPHRFDSNRTTSGGYILGHDRVSIPHRFDSNKQKKNLGKQLFLRFNPSQVRFKLEVDPIKREQLISFQSLTGSIQTGREEEWGAKHYWSFNPSQVRFKHRRFVNPRYCKRVSIPHRFDSN